MITLTYTTNSIIKHPTTKKIRDWGKITQSKVTKCIQNSYLLNSIFTYTDPNLIVKILLDELNLIVNHLAPEKIVNFEINHSPYLTKELKNEQKTKKSLINKAIKSNTYEDW